VGGIEQDGILGLPEGCRRAAHVALVAPADVLKYGRLIDIAAGGAKFKRAPPRPGLRRGNDEDLHVRLGADHGSNVAAVEHRAGRLRGEVALELEQRGAHLRNR